MSKYTYNKLKSICFEILKKVDNKLGSTNIKNTFYSRHLDKYIANEGIIFKQKNHTVDALVYEDINQLKKDKLSLIRNMYK